MDTFVSSGIYLAVEKLRHLAFRNLFKQCAILLEQEPEKFLPKEYADKPYIMPLQIPFESLIKWDQELDMDELECILANLISIGYIKGYISHEKSVLVMAKGVEKAFPVEAFNE